MMQTMLHVTFHVKLKNEKGFYCVILSIQDTDSSYKAHFMNCFVFEKCSFSITSFLQTGLQKKRDQITKLGDNNVKALN